MENAEIKSSSPRKQELSYGNEGEQLSGQTRGSACSLLAGGSKDTKVFSRPKTYAFIFKDLLLRRALFLQGQIPTSAEKLFQASCMAASGQRCLQSISPFTHICTGEVNVPCMQDERGTHMFWPRWPRPGTPQSRNPHSHLSLLYPHEGWQSHCSLLLPQRAQNKLLYSVQINYCTQLRHLSSCFQAILDQKENNSENSGGALFIFSYPKKFSFYLNLPDDRRGVRAPDEELQSSVTVR